MKVLCVFGTRPEAIKMCPVVQAIEKSEYLEGKVCITGQHREMLDQVIETFKIKVDYDLNIMKPNQNLSTITSDIILKLGEIYEIEKPDIVLFYHNQTISYNRFSECPP